MRGNLSLSPICGRKTSVHFRCQWDMTGLKTVDRGDTMSKLLEETIAKLAELPEEDQDSIGSRLLEGMASETH